MISVLDGVDAGDRNHVVWCRSYLKRKTVCSLLPTSADNVTLLAFAAERRPCSNRSISAGRRAHSSKQQQRWQPIDKTEGQTDRRTLESFIDPAQHTTRAVSKRYWDTSHYMQDLHDFPNFSPSTSHQSLYLWLSSSTPVFRHRLTTLSSHNSFTFFSFFQLSTKISPFQKSFPP